MHGEDPYPDQQMKTILSRLYPIDNWAWSGSSTSGTLLISYHFPNALINASTNLQEKLHRFQYLRAAVRVLIRLNATKFHAGKLLVTWVPCYKKGTTDSNAMQDMYSASCNNSVIVSANTTVPVDFIIPWVTPYSYWNMRDSYATTAQGLMGYIKVWVLHPLILAGASNTPSCNVTLYASFVDPEVAGPGLRNNDPRSDRALLKDESARKREQELVARLAAAQKIIQSQLANDFISGKEEKNVVAQMSMSKEQIVRSKDMTISNVAKAVSKFALGVSDAAKIIGLDKPTDLQHPTKVIQVFNSGFAHMTGMDGATRLAADPQGHVANEDRYADPRDYNLFSNYKLLPGLINVFSFDASFASGTKVLIMGVTPTWCHQTTTLGVNTYSMTPTAFLASLFRYWRGGLKYCLKFTMSQYTVGRIRITWLPDPTFTAAITNEEEGDTVSKVVDLNGGDTEVTFEIPYCQAWPWLDVITPFVANTSPIVQWAGFNGQIVVQVVNPLTVLNSTSTAVAWVAVYMSGAEDFQVARPFDGWSGYTDGTTADALEDEEEVLRSNDHAHAQMQTITQDIDPRAQFRMPFEGLVPCKKAPEIFSLNMGENIGSFTALLHRYTDYDGPTAKTANTLYSDDIRSWVHGSMHYAHRILRSFLFNAGGYRIKMKTSTVPTTYNTTKVGNWVTTETPIDNEFDARGIHESYSTTNPYLEFEVPYYWYFHMNDHFFQRSGPQYSYQCYVTSNVWRWHAVADDFSLGWPLAPIQQTSPGTF